MNNGVSNDGAGGSVSSCDVTGASNGGANGGVNRGGMNGSVRSGGVSTYHKDNSDHESAIDLTLAGPWAAVKCWRMLTVIKWAVPEPKDERTIPSRGWDINKLLAGEARGDWDGRKEQLLRLTYHSMVRDLERQAGEI